MVSQNSPTNSADDSRQLERESSAVTLSDMEIFIFPELLFSLVLANILSPSLWRWRDDPWFDGIERLPEGKRAPRLRQYIMDHYEFNLDLDTWGLTDKATELARFQHFVSAETLAESNALFGYTGDKHYFDVNIRKHFGLDKYDSDIIPYWKTETIEAMDAFVHKPGFSRGAGECVSFSALYAAAMFLICRIPLDRIFLMATPLHSQNFVLIDDGLITNNRRIVTKTMWFNGTEQSAKAQRALKNEQVTLVGHHTGHVHCVYPEASMDADAYTRFASALRDFLATPLTPDIFINFLRDHSRYQKYFQVARQPHATTTYIRSETVFAYEHNSPCKFAATAKNKLLAEIDDDDLHRAPIEGRLLFNDLRRLIPPHGLDLGKESNRARLRDWIVGTLPDPDGFLHALTGFCIIAPRLPERQVDMQPAKPAIIQLDPAQTREAMTEALLALRHRNPMADLAFHAARDLRHADLRPFLHAALTRNPVSIEATAKLDDAALIACFERMNDASIYDPTRLAQPDEVWNYQRGDGLERLICLANILLARHPDAQCEIRFDGNALHLSVTTGLHCEAKCAKSLGERARTVSQGGLTLRMP